MSRRRANVHQNDNRRPPTRTFCCLFEARAGIEYTNRGAKNWMLELASEPRGCAKAAQLRR